MRTFQNGNLESCTKIGRNRRAVERQSKRLVHIIASDFLFEVVWQTPWRSQLVLILASKRSVSQILTKEAKPNNQNQQICSLETDYDSTAISAKNYKAAMRNSHLSLLHDPLSRFVWLSLIQYAMKTTTFPCHFQAHLIEFTLPSQLSLISCKFLQEVINVWFVFERTNPGKISNLAPSQRSNAKWLRRVLNVDLTSRHDNAAKHSKIKAKARS